jgi:ArsR family transcriptional regulator, arsenate/arsenite/antimonite-responsive transcriptional repressor / arsenate reductase (thioredoxin)
MRVRRSARRVVGGDVVSAGRHGDSGLVARAVVHAALGEPARLAIVDELATSDRSPKELGDRLAIPSNLLAHHLDVLEGAGLVARSASAGDGRRKYVRLVRDQLAELAVEGRAPRGEMLFVCSHNSARSQLAAVLWTARTGRRASSAGTRPAARVHRGAVAAATRAGLSLGDAVPTPIGDVPASTQVVTVCDLVHEELVAGPDWWHWSIPDPVEAGDPAAFDSVVAELDSRIASVMHGMHEHGGDEER